MCSLVSLRKAGWGFLFMKIKVKTFEILIQVSGLGSACVVVKAFNKIIYEKCFSSLTEVSIQKIIDELGIEL
jgi:hypothetical protein